MRDFCYYAFKHVGIELEFVGEGAAEKGVIKSINPQSAAATNALLSVGDVLIEVSPDFFRPTDVVNLWGDPSKAREQLGWDPQKTTFEELVKIMVESDMAKVAVERTSEHITTNLVEYLEKGIVK